jgi:hypothetical protein
MTTWKRMAAPTMPIIRGVRAFSTQKRDSTLILAEYMLPNDVREQDRLGAYHAP